jgi:hypothetical protein
MMTLEDVQLLGENDGWGFYVGRTNGRWIGFGGPSTFTVRLRRALQAEGLIPEQAGLFIFPEVSEGYALGVLDKDRAIRLTLAVACDSEHGFGGIERWHVPESLRPGPDEFRCENCETIGCDGKSCVEEYSAYDDEFPV